MHRHRCSIVALTVLVTCTAAADEPICPGVLRTVEVNGPSDITGVGAVDNLAVTADSYGLTTWDLNDPTAPSRVGSWAFGRGYEPQEFFRMDVILHPVGKWACLTPTFTCFDLRELEAPQPFEWQTDEWPAHYEPDGGDSLRGTAINDRLIAARHIRHVARFSDIWLLDTSKSGPYEWIKPDAFRNRFMSVADLAFMDDHLLVLDMVDGLFVFDVSDPGTPRETASVEVTDLHFITGRLFAGDPVAVAVFDGYQQAPLAVDLTNPGSPQVYDIPMGFHWYDIIDMDLEGDRGVAIVGRSVGGYWYPFVEEVDFSDPSEPVIIGTRDTSSDSVASTGAEWVTGSATRLTVHERGGNLDILGETPTESGAHALDVSGSLGVVANGDTGVLTLDLSYPEYPRATGRLDIGKHATNIRLRGSTAIVLSANFLSTVDVSNPARPRLQDTIAVDGGRWILELDGEIVLVPSYTWDSGNDYQNHLVDVSNPNDIVHRSQFVVGAEPGERVTDLKAKNDIAFVAADGLVFAVDFGDPDDPTELGSVQVAAPGEWTAVGLSGNHLIAASYSGSRVIAISDPENMFIVRHHPELTGFEIGHPSPGLLAVSGWDGTYLADYSDPENPITYDVPTEFRGWWDAGRIVGSTWLRAAQPAIDVLSLECMPPQVDFRVSGHGPTIWFDDLSRYQIENSVWDFGDGQTSSYGSAIHTYDDPGTYTVTLSVSSANGSDTATETIEVGPMPVRHQPPGSRRP